MLIMSQFCPNNSHDMSINSRSRGVSLYNRVNSGQDILQDFLK